MKQAIGLIVGVGIGVAGGLMFSNSLAPEQGSVEERLEIKERELAQAQGRIRALIDDGARDRKRTVKDGVRDVMGRIRRGEEVSFDDIWITMRPWMRDMEPLFERMRQLNEDEFADRMVGEWAGDYDLSVAEKERLREWFKDRSRERAEAFSKVVRSNESGFVDFVQATEYDWRDAEGAEDLMEKILAGEELEDFKEKRLTERYESVQDESYRNLNRLDEIVELDPEQHAHAFGIMMRSSKDYREGMEFEGMEQGRGKLDRDGRWAAVDQILRPGQRNQLQAYRDEQKAEAEREMAKVGLSLPKDWELLENDRF
ncbi:MAG: hypothetical protein ACON5H_01140 [Akkermansiaceae bacterium]